MPEMRRASGHKVSSLATRPWPAVLATSRRPAVPSAYPVCFRVRRRLRWAKSPAVHTAGRSPFVSGRMIEELKTKLGDEVARLQHELTVTLPAEIRRAVELGDLRENSEYKAALERQQFVQARLGQLRQRLEQALAGRHRADPAGPRRPGLTCGRRGPADQGDRDVQSRLRRFGRARRRAVQHVIADRARTARADARAT